MSSRNDSSGSLPLNQGFTVFQPAVGSSLQFLPALGTPELDAMIDAYVAGPSSVQDKRAAVCLEFCNITRQTGESSLFFPVTVFPQHTFTASPASSLNDSGYGSSFNVSPVLSDMWATPASSSAAAPSQTRATKPAKPSSSRKPSTVSSRAAGGDFSHIPGMKIMTKDGVDVTNSASRGCKTKEQRDHAHLMRIIKACDACKRKKIRCDPSHKKRGSSQLQSPTESRQAKKAKASTPPAAAAAAAAPAAAPQFFNPVSPKIIVAEAPFHMDLAPLAPIDTFTAPNEELFNWEQFVQFGEENIDIPEDYDFFLDPQGLLTPSSASNSASFSPSQAFTPASPSVPAYDIAARSSSTSASSSAAVVSYASAQEPLLPYLHPDGHGTDYVDFTLFSPGSTSSLDEEPQLLQSPAAAQLGDDLQHQLWTPPSQSAAVAVRERPAYPRVMMAPAAPPRVPTTSSFQPTLEVASFDLGYYEDIQTIPSARLPVAGVDIARPLGSQHDPGSTVVAAPDPANMARPCESTGTSDGQRLACGVDAGPMSSKKSSRRLMKATSSTTQPSPSLPASSVVSAADVATSSVRLQTASPVSQTAYGSLQDVSFEGSMLSLPSPTPVTQAVARPASLPCQGCGKMFSREADPLRHETRVHNSPASPNHSCPLRGTFWRKDHFRDHLGEVAEDLEELISKGNFVARDSLLGDQKPVAALDDHSVSQRPADRPLCLGGVKAGVAGSAINKTLAQIHHILQRGDSQQPRRSSSTTVVSGYVAAVTESSYLTVSTGTSAPLSSTAASPQSAVLASGRDLQQQQRTPTYGGERRRRSGASYPAGSAPTSLTTPSAMSTTFSLASGTNYLQLSSTTTPAFLQTLALWAVAANLLFLPLFPTRQVQKGFLTQHHPQSLSSVMCAVVALLVVLGLVSVLTVSSSSLHNHQQQHKQHQHQQQPQDQDQHSLLPILFTTALSFVPLALRRSSPSIPSSLSSSPMSSTTTTTPPLPSRGLIDRLWDLRCAVSHRISRRFRSWMSTTARRT